MSWFKSREEIWREERAKQRRIDNEARRARLYMMMDTGSEPLLSLALREGKRRRLNDPKYNTRLRQAAALMG